MALFSVVFYLLFSNVLHHKKQVVYEVLSRWKIFTIILHWYKQLDEVQHNREPVPYFCLQEPLARCALHKTSVYFGHTVKSKDKGQVVLVSQKMGMPVKTILSCIIDSTLLCFQCETSK